MPKSLVRPSLPLFLLLGVLLAATLMLAPRHSPAIKEGTNPVQDGFSKPAAGPYNTSLTVPDAAVEGSKLPQSGPIVW
ncbi:hypothetical protein ETD83_12835 [Actinomadura soli]|uniref:Uncharacterized protein n=1 Tax=Actinomadura soli TaxID=2508997 RepID=A0A5C4JDB8_9ACTN|nr:hypothetical protein [Actinomadura soli]TMR02256.1 hypothetical protein ETD83_12835 [Actinomadura soli]